MVSKNQLLGHGAPNTLNKVESKPFESLKLYREDVPEGRVFPAEMVEMMKRKKWTEIPIKIDDEIKTKESKIDHSDEKE